MLIASGLLALLVAATFAVLLSSVADLRALERRARRSEEVLEVANVLERQVVDLETAQRGFVITRRERFLRPWRDARAAFPAEARTLEQWSPPTPSRRPEPVGSPRPPPPTSGTTRSRWCPRPGGT
jgi:CHASE3 domain sensor protein